MTHHTDAEQERAEFDLYWLDRQRKRGFGQQLTDKEMLAYPERRADEFHAWQAARRDPAVPATHEPPFWFPHLRDRADGVAGHYSIARRNPGKNFLEYISPLGNWVGYGAQVFSLEEAQEWMNNSALAAAPQPPEDLKRENTTTKTAAGCSVSNIETKAAHVQLPEPIETVRYWRDAYADPKGDEHFMGHGMVVKIFDDYLALLAQHGIK